MNSTLSELKAKDEKYYGHYVGVVRSSMDPEELGRCRVEVLPMFKGIPVLNLPWAIPKFTLNRTQIPQEGATVWVFFLEGDVYQPVYESSALPVRNLGGATVHAWATTGLGDPKFHAAVAKARVELEDSAAMKLFLEEPSQGANPQYPYNDVLVTPGGIVIELDDTPGARRVHVSHPKGTFISMNESGELHIRCFGDKTDSTRGNERVHVHGNSSKTVDGNSNESVAGNKGIAAANVTILADQSLLITADEIRLQAARIDLNGGG